MYRIFKGYFLDFDILQIDRFLWRIWAGLKFINIMYITVCNVYMYICTSNFSFYILPSGNRVKQDLPTTKPSSRGLMLIHHLVIHSPVLTFARSFGHTVYWINVYTTVHNLRSVYGFGW